MTYSEFEKEIEVLLETFPEKKINMQNVWPRFQDMDREIFAEAIFEITEKESNIQFANVIALIKNTAKNTGSVDDQMTAEAWEALVLEIRKTGYMGVPKFTDPVLAKTVSCMGWRDLCASENSIADRAHFFKLYAQFAAKLVKKKDNEDLKILMSKTPKRDKITSSERMAELTSKVSRDIEAG